MRGFRRVDPYEGNNLHVVELILCTRRSKLRLTNIRAKCSEREVRRVSAYNRLRNEHIKNWFKKSEYEFKEISLETQDSNLYYLGPKSSALPIKLVSSKLMECSSRKVLNLRWIQKSIRVRIRSFPQVLCRIKLTL